MAASIQKLGVSAVNAVAENNVSLLHGNFDFSLVKCQVPAELIPLGERLSKQRRETAEDGPFHILAQRLGILFEEVLPNVPSLLRAYGTRASEITKMMDNVPGAPQSVKEGVFGPHLGIDSTSIWASATSGTSALCMHLLALQASETDAVTGNYISQLAAVHEIDTSTLEGWDASARAWLQLIVNNLSVAVKAQGTSEEEQPINYTRTRKENLHDNVILNLCRALSTLDKSVMGNPQKISDGGVLLAMTSWHLYPDLIVLDRKSLDISQGDELVHEGGIATISVSTYPDPHDKQIGVYWSLPLANLRYKTVRRERSSFHDSRLSIVELQALAFGASLDTADDAVQGSIILMKLWVHCYNVLTTWADMWSNASGIRVPREQADKCHDVRLYMSAIQGGMELLLSEDKKDQDVAMHLIRYGANYGRSWIGNDRQHSNNFFGLAHLPSLLKLIGSAETRILVLLEICRQHPMISDSYIIRYLKDDKSWGHVSPVQVMKEKPHLNKRRRFEAVPERGFSELEPPSDENWYFTSSRHSHHIMGMDRVVSEEELQSHNSTFEYLNNDPDDRPSVNFDLKMGCYDLAALFVRKDARSRDASFADTVPISLVNDLLESNCLETSEVMECFLGYFAGSGVVHGRSLIILGESMAYYKSHLPQTRVSIRVIKEPMYNWKWTRQFIDLIQANSSLSFYIGGWYKVESNAQDEAQQEAQGESQKKDLLWIPPYHIKVGLEFAIILQFETGTISVDPDDLKDVMAISCGNSLFIARCLLQDPVYSLRSNQNAVVHAIGNVGKPGVALMHAPVGVEIREHDIDRWHVVSHSQFDGSLSDGVQFDKTSLHMSFTGGKGPISVGPSGFRGMEAYYLETKVSLYDGGEWVADLDILNALGRTRTRLWSSNLGPNDGVCSHDTSFTHSGMKLISIDCWEEILSPPPSPLILSSGPSWMARLAGRSIGSSK
ncbi:hypothetical protein BJX99DRAFT_248478 [Aspergillus californicus]